MQPALKYAPFPKEFPVAKTTPVWKSHDLQYAMSGGYYSQSSGNYSQTTQQKPNSNDGNQGFVQVPGGNQP
jgi:hypothetical protein